MVLKLYLKKMNLFMFQDIPNRDDLREMYEWVKLNVLFLSTGEHRHMIEHMKFAKEMNVPNPVQVENGDIVKLFPGTPEVFDKAPSGQTIS
jgi:ribonuclease J